MRIHFKHVGHANCYLKTCKRILASNLIGPDGGRIPTQRVRNALCQGLGYSNYDDLKRVMARRRDNDYYLPSPNDLRAAFASALALALAVAEGYGFLPPEPAETFALRHAGELVRRWY
jgi:hypothetical protein